MLLFFTLGWQTSNCLYTLVIILKYNVVWLLFSVFFVSFSFKLFYLLRNKGSNGFIIFNFNFCSSFFIIGVTRPNLGMLIIFYLLFSSTLAVDRCFGLVLHLYPGAMLDNRMMVRYIPTVPPWSIFQRWIIRYMQFPDSSPGCGAVLIQFLDSLLHVCFIDCRE